MTHKSANTATPVIPADGETRNMADTQDLKGRTAVVTGASRGLGRAIAERLERAGAAIVAVDLPAALPALPAHWRAEPLDLTDADAQGRLKALARAWAPSTSLSRTRASSRPGAAWRNSTPPNGTA